MKFSKTIFAGKGLLLTFLLVCLLSFAVYFMFLQVFLSQEVTLKNNRAAFYALTIEDDLNRLGHLPFVVAQHPDVVRHLQSGSGNKLNPLLKRIGARANAEAVYVMDTDGLTIAASNFDSSGSFVGQQYTFRPYFTEAMTGKSGRFFAIGATTGRPGYFVSDPVKDASGNIIGVVVAKIGLAELSRSWGDTDESILVTNAESVVLLSSSQEYLYGTLEPLSNASKIQISERRQFADQPLMQLEWEDKASGRVTLNRTSYVHATARIASEDWQLHLLTSLSKLQQRAALSVAAMIAVLAAIVVAVTGFRSARLQRALQVSDADRLRLADEIDVRIQTEHKLRTAQGELERASHLAALGQLSASITHELGQPISAMRNYLAAEEIAGAHPPGSLNSHLNGLVDRMQNITKQLRFFATPSANEQQVFDLRDVLEAALELLQHSFIKDKVEVAYNRPEMAFKSKADQHRVEQVLVNLLRNAGDAVRDQEDSRIEIALEQNAETVFVQITDGGKGLQGRTLTELEVPFFTSKSSGEGMGLGLAISTQIVKELGGQIRAEDSPDGGAIFSVTLPRYKEAS